MSRYFFTSRREIKQLEVLEASKSSTCKKIKQEEQERGCGDFGASRTIFLTVIELLMV